MKIIEITIKEGFFQKTIVFSNNANIIYSQMNTAGKTTFIRSLFYALGYPIPSTKGIRFDKMEFWISVESNGKLYKLYRRNTFLSMEDNQGQIDYSLPSDFYELHTKLTECDNKDILDNMLGASYMDQEKGWTLLNRGKVIGNIPFSIESLVRGLGGKECAKELLQLEAVKHQQKKYEYMYSVAEYQEAIREAGEDVEYDAPDEIIYRRIEALRAKREPISEELKQIKSILRKNKLLVDYITQMKLTVKSETGEEVQVTKDTLVGFIDNNEFLTARREMLAAELGELNGQITSLEKQQGKEKELFKVQTAIEAFDSSIKKIRVDSIATRRIIDRLKKERRELQERIRSLTKSDNGVVLGLHNCISSYAKELGVSETYVSPNKDYIFTDDLKSLSGTILHKIVFSFKLAYIKLIKEKTGIILPIVLDSPSGREVEYSTVEKMLKIIQRDYSDHQLIVASIYDYELTNKKKIEFMGRLFSPSDLMTVE